MRILIINDSKQKTKDIINYLMHNDSDVEITIKTSETVSEEKCKLMESIHRHINYLT